MLYVVLPTSNEIMIANDNHEPRDLQLSNQGETKVVSPMESQHPLRGMSNVRGSDLERSGPQQQADASRQNRRTHSLRLRCVRSGQWVLDLDLKLIEMRLGKMY